MEATINFLLFPIHFIYRVIRRFGLVGVARLMHLPQSGCATLRCDRGYSVRAIKRDELDELIKSKRVPRHVGKAKQLRDRRRALVAVIHDDHVVAYLWIAKQAIDRQNNYGRRAHLGTSIDMPDGTAFVYNTWVSRKHRDLSLVHIMLSYAVRNRVVGAWACLALVDWTKRRLVQEYSEAGMKQLGWVNRIGRGPLQISMVPRAALRIGLRVADNTLGLKMAA